MSDVAIQNSRKHGSPISLDCVANARNDGKCHSEAKFCTSERSETGFARTLTCDCVAKQSKGSSEKNFKTQSVEEKLCSESLQHANTDKMLNRGIYFYPQRPVLQHDRQYYDDKQNVKTAFTLAEVLITIVILGIVALLVLPNTIKNYQTTVNKTKIKKAMAIYDNVINEIITLNRIYNASALNAYANDDGQCTTIKSYFKVTEQSGCTFKTSDGVWWNFTNANKPMVAFKKANLKQAKAYQIGDYDTFYFVTAFQNNVLKINDLNYSQGTLNYADIFDTNAVIGWGYTLPVRKLWKFLGRYEFVDYSKYEVTCQGSTTIACTKCTTSGNDTTCKTYNENGTQILSCKNYNSATGKCAVAIVNGYNCYRCDKYGQNALDNGYGTFSFKEGFSAQVRVDKNGVILGEVLTIYRNRAQLQKCDINMRCEKCSYPGGDSNCEDYKKIDENGKTYYSP